MSKQNGRGQVIQPGRQNVTPVYADGPLAQPLAVTANTPNGFEVLGLGGLTKVEAIAATVAAGLVQPGVLSMPPTEIDTPSSDAAVARDKAFECQVAIRSVNIAEAILNECRSRQAANSQST